MLQYAPGAFSDDSRSFSHRFLKGLGLVLPGACALLARAERLRLARPLVLFREGEERLVLDPPREQVGPQSCLDLLCSLTLAVFILLSTLKESLQFACVIDCSLDWLARRRRYSVSVEDDLRSEVVLARLAAGLFLLVCF